MNSVRNVAYLKQRNKTYTVHMKQKFAMSRLPVPTAEVRFRAQVRSCGICGGRNCTGAGFLRVLPFPLPILIAHSSSTIRGW
jgi:hypothetical protein